jgi:hypothetical protein
MGTGGSFREAKRPGREADHWPPSSSGVKYGGVIPPLPTYVFMAWCLNNENFTCTFTFTMNADVIFYDVNEYRKACFMISGYETGKGVPW